MKELPGLTTAMPSDQLPCRLPHNVHLYYFRWPAEITSIEAQRHS